MNRRSTWLALAALLLLAALALWWWQRPGPANPAPPPLPVATAPAGPDSAAPAAALPASAAASAAAEVAPPPPPSTEPPLAADDWPSALTALLGRDQVLRQLQTDDFARRLVATVDNLGRDSAPSRLWPVNPSPGRFQVSTQDGRTVVAASNAQRYQPLVQLLASLPAPAVVALYARAYPQLQQAYAELGYPKGSFHQRLLQVIDLLLATPEPPPPLALTLTEVKGPIPSARPWVRYEAADPALQRLSSGQKILLRLGPDHAQRLKAQLRALRTALAPAAGVKN